MATLIVRRVDARLVDALKERALRHGRSAEAEHRAILEAELIGHTPSAQEMLDYLKRALTPSPHRSSKAGA
ncbi:MAG: hypothetical protein WAS21_32425 [Geminicoccaceae bacterium]